MTITDYMTLTYENMDVGSYWDADKILERVDFTQNIQTMINEVRTYLQEGWSLYGMPFISVKSVRMNSDDAFLCSFTLVKHEEKEEITQTDFTLVVGVGESKDAKYDVRLFRKKVVDYIQSGWDLYGASFTSREFGYSGNVKYHFTFQFLIKTEETEKLEIEKNEREMREAKKVADEAIEYLKKAEEATEKAEARYKELISEQLKNKEICPDKKTTGKNDKMKKQAETLRQAKVEREMRSQDSGINLIIHEST